MWQASPSAHQDGEDSDDEEDQTRWTDLVALRDLEKESVSPLIFFCTHAMEKSTGLMGSRSMGIPEFNEVCTSRKLRTFTRKLTMP